MKDIANEVLNVINESLPVRMVDNDAVSFIANHYPDFNDDDTLIAVIQALFDACEKYGVTISYKEDMADPVFVLRKGFLKAEVVAMSGRFTVYAEETFATEDSWSGLVKQVNELNACLKDWKFS